MCDVFISLVSAIDGACFPLALMQALWTRRVIENARRLRKAKTPATAATSLASVSSWSPSRALFPRKGHSRRHPPPKKAIKKKREKEKRGSALFLSCCRVSSTAVVEMSASRPIYILALCLA